MNTPALQPASAAHELRYTPRARVHVSTYNHRLHVELRWLDGVLDGNNAVLAVLTSGAVPSADYVLWDMEHQYAAELDKPAAEIVSDLMALDLRLLHARVAMLEDSAAYQQAYAAAQAGGMSNTDSHEFALDQATRSRTAA